MVPHGHPTIKCGSFDVPLSCNLQVLRPAPSAFEQRTEIAHGISITEIGCFLVPALGGLTILGKPHAPFAQFAQTIHGAWMA